MTPGWRRPRDLRRPTSQRRSPRVRVTDPWAVWSLFCELPTAVAAEPHPSNEGASTRTRVALSVVGTDRLLEWPVGDRGSSLQLSQAARLPCLSWCRDSTTVPPTHIVVWKRGTHDRYHEEPRAQGHQPCVWTDQARSVAGRLPDRIDLDNAAHARLLSELGLTPDRVFDDLGVDLRLGACQVGGAVGRAWCAPTAPLLVAGVQDRVVEVHRHG